jgi:alpha-beta hydrolase superfamily lysophospholipase
MTAIRPTTFTNPQASRVARPVPAPAVAVASAIKDFKVAKSAPLSYLAAKQAWQNIQAAEARLPLQKGMQTQLFLHDGPAPKGTIVMFHGFTAGPWQFTALAKKAYADGYNVVIPRLPGHGFKDANGKEDPSHLLDASNYMQYQAFGDQSYARAAALGGPVSVMGLSVGGNIALDVAERHSVAKVVEYAPFLAPAGVGGKIASIVHGLDKLTFGLAGKGLAHVPWGWGKESEKQTADGSRPGHALFSLGTLYGAAEYGRMVTNNAKKVTAPVEFFTTGADTAADEGAIKRAYLATNRTGQDGWYHYPKAENVAHAMIEERGIGQTALQQDLTLSFMDGHGAVNRNEAQ